MHPTKTVKDIIIIGNREILAAIFFVKNFIIILELRQEIFLP